MRAIKRLISAGYNLFFFIRHIAGGNVSLGVKSDIEGCLSAKCEKEASIRIGNIHVMGPLYLKACRKSTISIANGCFFNHNVSITAIKSVVIGKNCSFGNNVVIVDHNHDYKRRSGTFISDRVLIGDNVWIGANAVVLKGTIIEDDAVIGAGSIVNTHVPSRTVYTNAKKDQLQPYRFEV